MSNYVVSTPVTVVIMPTLLKWNEWVQTIIFTSLSAYSGIQITLLVSAKPQVSFFRPVSLTWHHAVWIPHSKCALLLVMHFGTAARKGSGSARNQKRGLESRKKKENLAWASLELWKTTRPITAYLLNPVALSTMNHRRASLALCRRTRCIHKSTW